MKIKVKNLVVLSFVLFVHTVQAQTKNKFDQFYEECIGQSNGKNVTLKADCLRATREKWEEDIEINFKILVAATSERERSLLKLMHSNWEKYKESKFKLLDERYGEKAGNSSVLLEEEKIKFVKQYAQEMKNMVNSLQSTQFQTGAYN